MYIKRICYPTNTLGPGNRVGIWTTGCEQHCEGCMSPELRRRDSGQPCSVEKIILMIAQIQKSIDGFTISGGEPFLQAYELARLVQEIRLSFSDDIIVYSGYSLKELHEKRDPSIESVLQNISVLIDGPYIDQLNDGMGIRGSSNQKIHIFRDVADYTDLGIKARSLQTFRYNSQILLIGIQ